MKPLSELVKEIRARQEACSGDLEEPLAALAHDCWKQCADELQAWLREADEYLRVEQKLCEKVEMQLSDGGKYNNRHYGGRAFSCGRFREVLLGTTQKPRQEGESSK